MESDLQAEIEKIKKDIADVPGNVSQTEQLLKFGAIIPLMLILGNHLGNFLPYTLTSEIRSSNRHRNSSLLLIFALLVISFYGSIDYTAIPKVRDHPKIFPLMDLMSAFVAMILLLMMLRFSHDWMYAVFLVLVLVTMGLFYSAKKKSEQERANNPDAPSPKEIGVVKALMWVGIFMIIVFYIMSLNFMNQHYTDFYNTDLTYTLVNNETWFAKTKPYFHFREYMFTPRSMDNPEAFSKLTRLSKNNFTLDYFKFNKSIPRPLFELHNPTVTEHVKQLKEDCNKLTFNEVTKQRNAYFIGNSDQIISTHRAPTPAQIWNNQIPKKIDSNYTFFTKKLMSNRDIYKKTGSACLLNSNGRDVTNISQVEMTIIDAPLLENTLRSS